MTRNQAAAHLAKRLQKIAATTVNQTNWTKDDVAAVSALIDLQTVRQRTQAKDTAGLVATVVRVDVDPPTVETVTIPHGTAGAATRELIGRLDGADGEWRVRTICTPATVLRDLQGTRGGVGRPVADGGYAQAEYVQTPERTYLGKQGRLDLLEQPTNDRRPRPVT